MNNLLENLNEKQKEAVLKTEGPVMAIAGAGSGKTSVLTTRIAYLIYEKDVPCDRILAITFHKLLSNTREANHRVKRSRLHQVFIAWKFLTREKKLLKKYLKESNIEEHYATTPLTTFRYEVPKIITDSQLSPLSMESVEGGSSS